MSREPPNDALASANARLGTTVDGKYRLRALLGIGGMGLVYDAEHLFLSRHVALKILHPRYADTHEGATRFLKEARAAGSIGHRAIVQVMDAGFVDGTTPYLVMELLEGENLEQRIDRRSGIRVKQAAVVLREMMKGLAAAHAKGIVHCDLKPANVFLVERAFDVGAIKILDFGISKMAHDKMTSISDSGEHVMGTPQYMAPEQVKGGTLSTATDIYGAGAVIYEALTGVSAFAARSRVESFVKILRDPPPPIVGKREPVPPQFAALIEKMLAKEPGERPASPQDVIQLLEDFGLVPPSGSSGRIQAAKPRRE